jgi:toxin ParE1/3/4
LRRTIRKSALAESDLINIWQYSFEQWNAEQADKYLDELDDAIQLLADNPELGVNRDFVRAGYRVIFVNRHAIYYTAAPSAIDVVRVLHEQMDPGRHL